MSGPARAKFFGLTAAPAPCAETLCGREVWSGGGAASLWEPRRAAFQEYGGQNPEFGSVFFQFRFQLSSFYPWGF